MQVLYLIKEKGVDINSFLNEVNQVTFHENASPSQSQSAKKNQNNEEYNNENNLIIDSIGNESEISDVTVYFPDKIKMNNIMDTKWGKNIPKLNFGYVPEYTSDSESDKNGQKNNNNNNYNAQMNDIMFANIKKFQNSV